MSKRRLTGKQTAFVAAYLDTLNATEAARRAGYKGTAGTLAAVGYENLRKPHLAEAIAEGMKGLSMSQDEVLLRATLMARGMEPTRINQKPDGTESQYDQAKALELIAKVHGMLRERLEIDGTIDVMGFRGVSPDDWDEDAEDD